MQAGSNDKEMNSYFMQLSEFFIRNFDSKKSISSPFIFPPPLFLIFFNFVIVYYFL